MMTFNDMPEAMATLLDRVAVLQAQVQHLTNKLEKMQEEEQKRPTGGENRLICGIFKPGEFIHLSDHRLWEGESAPFKSRYAALESRKRGARWHAKGSNRSYVIKAEALADYLECKNNNKIFMI